MFLQVNAPVLTTWICFEVFVLAFLVFAVGKSQHTGSSCIPGGSEAGGSFLLVTQLILVFPTVNLQPLRSRFAVSSSAYTDFAVHSSPAPELDRLPCG